MAEVHRLLEQHGKTEVLKLNLDRRIVEAAATYMGSEDGEIGFLYSGWAQSGLPHKRLADDASWQVRTDHVSLLVQPGQRHTTTGDPIPVGVPYGSRARLICLYLQSEDQQPRDRARPQPTCLAKTPRHQHRRKINGRGARSGRTNQPLQDVLSN